MSKLGPLREKIERTDGLIDAVVYELYGLTEEEINCGRRFEVGVNERWKRMSNSEDDSKIEFEEIRDEIGEEIKLDEDKRTVLTKSSDPEITSLYEKWKRGRLILQPEFQRKFVWDRKKASRLIESALLSVPLPLFYLAENADGKEYVIDGQQRLTSFFSFIDGKLPNGEDFKLTDMKVYSELNKKGYADLNEAIQEKILYYNLRTITILKESDPDLKFEIFERLNTGSVPLNDMELRNCVYRGPYIDHLKELATDRDFGWLLKLSGPDKRMRDVELVLRFASFYHATYLKYKPSMRQFFNRDMDKFQFISKDEYEDLRRSFKNSIQIVKSLFGENAFKRFHPGTKSIQKAHGKQRSSTHLFSMCGWGSFGIKIRTKYLPAWMLFEKL